MRPDEVPGQRTTVGKSESHGPAVADLYELLEISPHASQEVIQAAYRTLARFYHPDVNASAAAAHRIRQLNAAYTVLSDPQHRARYDLECLREHRFERLAQPGHSGTLAARWPGASRNRALPLCQPMVRQGPVYGRHALTNGVAIVGLLMVAALAAIFLVVIAMSTETAGGYSPVFNEQSIPFAQR